MSREEVLYTNTVVTSIYIEKVIYTNIEVKIAENTIYIGFTSLVNVLPGHTISLSIQRGSTHKSNFEIVKLGNCPIVHPILIKFAPNAWVVKSFHFTYIYCHPRYLIDFLPFFFTREKPL